MPIKPDEKCVFDVSHQMEWCVSDDMGSVVRRQIIAHEQLMLPGSAKSVFAYPWRHHVSAEQGVPAMAVVKHLCKTIQNGSDVTHALLLTEFVITVL